MISENDFNNLEGWFWYEEAKIISLAILETRNLTGVIVEAGSYKGKSTITMASCTNDDIYAIDPFMWEGGSVDDFKKNTYEYKNIICIQDDAVNYGQSFNLPIKLLFIDCDHSYSLTKNIYETYLPLMIENGIILFHDSTTMDIKLEDLISDEETNALISINQDAWIGPTKVLQEAQKKYENFEFGARSLWGVRIKSKLTS